jgi:mannose-6-phosphate isomerase-like protein (cupin superfamily)
MQKRDMVLRVDLHRVERYSKESLVFQVLLETERSQAAFMALEPGQGTDGGIHENSDQLLYVVKGQLRARVSGEEVAGGPGTLLLIPAGTRHTVRNPEKERLLLLSVYAPPAY